MKLEEGTIEALYNNQTSNPLFRFPKVQITSLGKLGVPGSDKQRYRVNISDGRFYMKAIFSSDLSTLFEKSLIGRYSIICFSKFTVRSKDGNVYIYIQEVREYEECNKEIGSPVNIATGGVSPVVTNQSPNNQNLDNQSPNNQSPNNQSPNNQNLNNQSPSITMDLTNQGKLNKIKPPMKENAINHPQQGKTTPNQSVNHPPVNTTPKSHLNSPKQQSHSRFTPINSLNPFHNKWTIKGRVLIKSGVKKFTSQKGEGKLFSFEMADASSQVKLVAFGDVVDIFFPIVDTGKVYSISKGAVKMANKQFSNNNFDYEIHLDKNSEIIQEEEGDIPELTFSFTKINNIVHQPNPSAGGTASIGSVIYDVIGIVKEVYPVNTILSKYTNRENTKRDIILVDETGIIRLTLWGDKTEKEVEVGNAMALKGVRTGEYNGVNISSNIATQILINPDLTEAHDLLGWYQEEGKDVKYQVKSGNKISAIEEVKEKELTYSNIKGTLMYIKEDNLYYESCMGEGCNKKVSREDEVYRCERCNKTYDECNYKYIVSVNVSDYTGQIWGSFFDDVAVKIFGVTAGEIKKMREEESTQIQNIVKRLYFKEYVFRVKSRTDSYNNEVRTKYNILEVKEVDYKEEIKKMLLVV